MIYSNILFVDVLILVIVAINFVLVLGTKKDLTKNIASSNANSHEELHSKNDSSKLFHDSKGTNVTELKLNGNPSAPTINSHEVNSTLSSKAGVLGNLTSIPATSPNTDNLVFAEGGVKASIRNNPNETNTSTPASAVSQKPSSSTKINNLPSNQTSIGTSDKPIHKRIHGRPGVSEIDSPVSSTPTISTTTNTTLSTRRPKKKKPLFTMITGDEESKESESFIESSTTGRDYVLPIVLIILSLPIIGYIIKIIYRRGTEFTERQQYHRMYLIDGMYNSR